MAMHKNRYCLKHNHYAVSLRLLMNKANKISHNISNSPCIVFLVAEDNFFSFTFYPPINYIIQVRKQIMII